MKGQRTRKIMSYKVWFAVFGSRKRTDEALSFAKFTTE